MLIDGDLIIYSGASKFGMFVSAYTGRLFGMSNVFKNGCYNIYSIVSLFLGSRINILFIKCLAAFGMSSFGKLY